MKHDTRITLIAAFANSHSISAKKQRKTYLVSIYYVVVNRVATRIAIAALIPAKSNSHKIIACVVLRMYGRFGANHSGIVMRTRRLDITG
jgi:hypothetical protein